MAPVFDLPHEEHFRLATSRRRALRSLAKRENEIRVSSDGLSGGSAPAQIRSTVLSLRDDHGLSHDGAQHDGSRKQKNKLQQSPAGNADNVDDRSTNSAHKDTPPPSPLTAIPANLNSLLPTFSTPTSSHSSRLSTGSFSPLPSLPGATAPAALNPQVVTVSSVTIMTTTHVIVPTPSPSSFITSLFPPSTTTSSQSASAAFQNAPPSPTIFISDSGDGNHDGSHRGGPPPGALSPTAEDVLISAGSIGAFILICFVCWMSWRLYKQHGRAKYSMDRGGFSPPNALLAKIPYFGRNQRAWQDLDAPDGRRSAPMYERSGQSKGTRVSIYSTNSLRDVAQPSERQGPTVLPQLNTNVAFSPASYAQVNPFSATASTPSPSGTIQSHTAQSPQNPFTQRRNSPYDAEQTHSMTLPQIQTRFSHNDVNNNPFASPEDAIVATESSPKSATQYGGDGTMQTFATSGTDRSRMPGYFNQSELARTASAAYDPATRAVYRASELSSLSSGFGDGDIIVPPMATLQPGMDLRSYSYAKSSDGLSRANSVANRSEAGSNGQRDTIYTTTSEDMPIRYRSVNSWVSQQTGRVERQQRQNTDEDIPPVPMLPPEQRLTMMMDDGEEPRRYEDTLSSMPPMPALPTQNVLTRPLGPSSTTDAG